MSPDVEEAFQEGLDDVSPWVRAASALMMAKHLTADDGSLAPLVDQIESAQAPVRRWLMRDSWKLAEPVIKSMEAAKANEEVAAAAGNALRQVDLKLESYTRPSELRL